MRAGLTIVASVLVLLTAQSSLLAQMFGPPGQGTSYGMFGPRTMGTPLAPAPRSLFASEPRDRLGGRMGVGLGGPINVYGLSQSYEAFPPVNSTFQTPPFSTQQAEVTQAVLDGTSQAVRPILAMPQAAPVAPTAPQAPAPAPPAQPMRSPAAPSVQEPQAMQGAGVLPSASMAAAPTDHGFPSFPTTLNADFATPTSAGRSGLQVTLGRLDASWVQTIQMVQRGDTLVLRGEVPSDHDRHLIEQLARLEPGVWNVRNELTVSSASLSRAAAR